MKSHCQFVVCGVQEAACIPVPACQGTHDSLGVSHEDDCMYLLRALSSCAAADELRCQKQLPLLAATSPTPLLSMASSAAWLLKRIAYSPHRQLYLCPPAQLDRDGALGCEHGSVDAALWCAQMFLRGKLRLAEQRQQEGDRGEHRSCISSPAGACFA